MKANISIRKVFGAVSFLWVSSLGGAGLAFLTQVVLARELTPAGYGVFAASLATITLVSPLAGFGVQGFWLKLFGAEGWHAIRWLPPSFRFVFISTFSTLFFITIWATWGPHDATVQRLLYWLSSVVVGSLFMELVSGKLQLEERYKMLALWHILPNLSRLLLVLLVVGVAAQPSLVDIAAVYTLTSLFLVVVGFVHLRAMAHGRFTLKGHTKPIATEVDKKAAEVRLGLLDIVRGAWPFGLSGVFYLLYFQSDIILLKYLVGSEAAGVYNVAFTIMAAVYLLPSVIYQKFLLPKLHRWANHDRTRFLQVYRIGNGSMLLFGGLATVVLLLLVPLIVPLLFGSAYQSAVSLLGVLVFCAPVRFLATSVGATLVTQEHMQRKIFYMGAVAVINLSLNLLLIPSFATMGAAVATLMSECALLALYLIAVRRHVFGAEAWRGWTINFKRGNE